jgi:hypothetical protein
VAALEDGTEKIHRINERIWSPAADGSQFDILIGGLRAAVDEIPNGAIVFILSPQTGLVDLYLKTREQRRKERYHSGGKPRPQAKLLRDVDDVTEERNITLIGRMPELHHEFDRLEELREVAKEHWKQVGADDH